MAFFVTIDREDCGEMFFDDDTDNREYEGLLIEYAQKGKEILQCVFQMNTRNVIQEPKGFLGFGRRKNNKKEILLFELEAIKKRIIDYRKQQGYANGVFWWSIPWENVENALIYDLLRKQNFENWRFAYQPIVEGKDGYYAFGLLEEGHCSMFSTTSNYETGIISNYSVDEINEKMHHFNKRMTEWDLFDLATIRGSVHSTVSGIDYDSIGDYLLSTEHFALRQYANDVYARSLYTEHETQVVTAESNSIHYKRVLAVGGYHLDASGRVDHIRVMDYKILDKVGSDYGMEYYENRDAAVELAVWLSTSSDVKSVPMKLFGNQIEESNSDYDDALRQAEITICLANKMSV